MGVTTRQKRMARIDTKCQPQIVKESEITMEANIGYWKRVRGIINKWKTHFSLRSLDVFKLGRTQLKERSTFCWTFFLAMIGITFRYILLVACSVCW
jgi:hypothetical protein